MKTISVIGLMTMCSAAVFGATDVASATLPVTFDGGGFVTVVGSGCAGSGFAPGIAATVVFRPKLTASDASEGLLFDFFKGSIVLLSTSKGGTLRGSNTYVSFGSSNYAMGYSNGATGGGTANFTFTPAVITATTPNVTFTGTISNPYGVKACVLTFKGAATLRP